MAVERDSSYSAYAPADTRELLDKLRDMGHDIPNPVWTVGRLDERKSKKKAAKVSEENGNGGHHDEADGPG